MPGFGEEKSDGANKEEKELSESGMEDSQFVLIKRNAKAAQQALDAYGQKSDHPEPAQPSAIILKPQPDREDGGEEANRRGDQTVGMFVKNSIPSKKPVGKRESKHVIPVAGGPIGYCHAGTMAGD
jgi:hypothetical protein